MEVPLASILDETYLRSCSGSVRALSTDNARVCRTNLLTYRLLVSGLLKLPEHAVFISNIWIRTQTDSGGLNTTEG